MCTHLHFHSTGKAETSERALNGTAETIEMLTKDRDANEGSESDEVDLFSIDRCR